MDKKAVIERAADELLRAAGRYVDELGGTALVGGGIRIDLDDPTRPGNFRVSVQIIGRLPPCAHPSEQPDKERKE